VGRSDLHGLYVGLERAPPAGAGRLEGWLFDPRDGRGLRLAGRGGLYETLFAAPHGTVLGYAEEAGGAVVPLHAPTDPGAAALEAMHAGALDAMARFLRARRGRTGWPSVSRPRLSAAIARWVRHPSADEAAAFRAFHFGADQAAASGEQILYSLADRQVLGLVLRGTKLGMNHWIEGQVALAHHRAVRWAAAGPLWVRTQLRFLRRRVKRWRKRGRSW